MGAVSLAFASHLKRFRLRVKGPRGIERAEGVVAEGLSTRGFYMSGFIAVCI